jgi:hypothetical protein
MSNQRRRCSAQLIVEVPDTVTRVSRGDALLPVVDGSDAGSEFECR